MIMFFELLSSILLFLSSNFGAIGGFIIFSVSTLVLCMGLLSVCFKVMDYWYLNLRYQIRNGIDSLKKYIFFRKEVSKKIKETGKPYIHGKWKSGQWVEKSYYF